jgi:hypothetical protein
VRIPAVVVVVGGSGEERGEFITPPAFGEWVTALSVDGEVRSGAGAILRFLVEAVLKLGSLPLEPMKLQGQAEERRLMAKRVTLPATHGLLKRQ